ncbi:MAG: trypsin-like peptidase domain-containing protein [Planctomycetota bacterium]
MRHALTAALGLAMILAALPASPQSGSPDRRSVVKIESTSRTPNLLQPWTRSAASVSGGTGVILEGNRILTNAHVVDYASRILVQPHQSSDRFEANIVAIARGIDLALLELEDEAFFDEYPAATLSDELPTIGSTVTALGYPLGGDAMSVTEGVVSRVEHTGYKAETLGLRVQVDVALNPGNSGGPVFMGGTVIGVVFSGIPSAENIGYVIPTDEIRMFLNDVADGTYHGKPRIFARLQTAENDAVRDRLGLDRGTTGLIVTAEGPTPELKIWDVITAIGGHDIDNVGMIDVSEADDLRLHFGYKIPKLVQAAGGSLEGATVPVTVLRAGETLELELTVASRRDGLIRPLDGAYPSYVVYGPMVFTPAYSELMQSAGRAALLLASNSSPLINRLNDLRESPDEELVIVPAPFFPHRLTKGYELGVVPVVESVNGTPITSLAQMVELLEANTEAYTEFTFAGTSNETLVFRTEDLREATEDVLDDAGIRRQASDDLLDLLR